MGRTVDYGGRGPRLRRKVAARKGTAVPVGRHGNQGKKGKKGINKYQRAEIEKQLRFTLVTVSINRKAGSGIESIECTQFHSSEMMMMMMALDLQGTSLNSDLARLSPAVA